MRPNSGTRRDESRDLGSFPGVPLGPDDFHLNLRLDSNSNVVTIRILLSIEHVPHFDVGEAATSENTISQLYPFIATHLLHDSLFANECGKLEKGLRAGLQPQRNLHDTLVPPQCQTQNHSVSPNFEFMANLVLIHGGRRLEAADKVGFVPLQE